MVKSHFWLVRLHVSVKKYKIYGRINRFFGEIYFLPGQKQIWFHKKNRRRRKNIKFNRYWEIQMHATSVNSNSENSVNTSNGKH